MCLVGSYRNDKENRIVYLEERLGLVFASVLARAGAAPLGEAIYRYIQTCETLFPHHIIGLRLRLRRAVHTPVFAQTQM